jgi:hypothetical protein
VALDRHNVSMPTQRFRTTAAVIAAATVLVALTACAPPIHHVPKPGSLSTTTPKIRPTAKPTGPTLAVKPKSDYSFACSDLIGGTTLPTLFSVPMQPIVGSRLARVNKVMSIPSDYYVEVLGGLDCAWYDGQPSNDSNSTHDMELTILPVDSSVWTKFAQSAGDGVSGTTYTQCPNDPGYLSCQYDAYVNGSWYELDINNMLLSSSGMDVLPPAVAGIVSAINAKLSHGPAPQPDGPQKGTRLLPSDSSQLLTVADLKTDLKLPASASVTIDCTGTSDGPWEIGPEAETEVTGGTGCSFNTPDGGTYGGYDVLSGGQWAAKDAIANTAGEVLAVTVNQPQGSNVYTWTDGTNDPSADLIDYGNWISFYLYPPDDSEPASATTPSLALQNLVLSAEKTIGGN